MLLQSWACAHRPLTHTCMPGLSSWLPTTLNPFKANFFRVQPYQSPSLTSTDNISTTTYPIVKKNPPLERSFHCAANRENSDEKRSQIPRVHDKTLAKSGLGVFKAETNCSSAVKQLRSSFFLELIRIGFLHFVESTTSCHGNSRRPNSAPRLRRSRSIEGNEPSSNFEVLPRRCFWTDFRSKDILV